jgi:hypothetical protein
VLAFSLILTLSLTACGNGSTGGGGNKKQNNATISGDIVGQWTGTALGVTCVADVTTTTWTLSVGGSPFDNGTFSSWNGTTATLYSSGLKAEVGTATLNTSTTATIVIKSPSQYPGTYNMTKGTPSEGGENGVSISGIILGKWKGTVGTGGDAIEWIADITATTWQTSSGGLLLDKGIFSSWNGTTATLYNTDMEAEVGTATANSSTSATIVLKSPVVTKFQGTWTFTKM